MKRLLTWILLLLPVLTWAQKEVVIEVRSTGLTPVKVLIINS